MMVSKQMNSVRVPVNRYLERIGYTGSIENTNLETLTALFRAHLSSVPFENLDVAANIPVTSDIAKNFEKIITRKRGGWCYEVNPPFAALLRAIGFDAHLIQAHVLLGPPTGVRNHACIEVRLDTVPYLVDAGFGDAFITPLALDNRKPQYGGNGYYQIIDTPEGPAVHRIDADGVPQPQYRLILTDGKRAEVRVEEFEPWSAALQAEHDSFFRTKPFATRLLNGGPDRANVMLHRLKVVRGGVTEECDITTEERVRYLRELIGIEDVPYPPLAGPQAQ